MLLLAVVALALAALGAALHLPEARPRVTRRVVAWSAWPVAYAAVVTAAALATYPYAVDLGPDGGGGLEYLLQGLVGFPASLAPIYVGSSVTAFVAELWLVGMVQVGAVAAFCFWGYRWTAPRPGVQDPAPVR